MNDEATQHVDAMLAYENDEGILRAADPEPDTLAAIRRAQDKVRSLKATLTQAERAYREATSTLLNLLSEEGVTGKRYILDGEQITIVRGTTRRFDMVTMVEALGLGRFEEVTIPKIDTAEFDRQVAAGLISPEVAARCYTTVPRRPYVTFGKTEGGKE